MGRNKKKLTGVVRISTDLINFYEKLGNGNLQHGLSTAKGILMMANKNPSEILQQKFDEYTGLIKALASENHYEHFIDSGLPQVLFRFHKTGSVDFDKIQKKENEIE